MTCSNLTGSFSNILNLSLYCNHVVQECLSGGDSNWAVKLNSDTCKHMLLLIHSNFLKTYFDFDLDNIDSQLPSFYCQDGSQCLKSEALELVFKRLFSN